MRILTGVLVLAALLFFRGDTKAQQQIQDAVASENLDVGSAYAFRDVLLCSDSHEIEELSSLLGKIPPAELKKRMQELSTPAFMGATTPCLSGNFVANVTSKSKPRLVITNGVVRIMTTYGLDLGKTYYLSRIIEYNRGPGM